MADTDRYRKQHQTILEDAEKISSFLTVEKVKENSGDIRVTLSNLMGKLKVHLAMEDKSLYPRLLEHDSEQIKNTAIMFISEMGKIGETVEKYNEKWSNKTVIQKAPDVFIDETKGILKALEARIEKENKELYGLIDAI